MYVVYIFQYLAFFIETNIILTEEKMFTIKKKTIFHLIASCLILKQISGDGLIIL